MYFRVTSTLSGKNNSFDSSSAEYIEELLREGTEFEPALHAAFNNLYKEQRGAFAKILKTAAENQWGGIEVKTKIEGLDIRIFAGYPEIEARTSQNNQKEVAN